MMSVNYLKPINQAQPRRRPIAGAPRLREARTRRRALPVALRTFGLFVFLAYCATQAILAPNVDRVVTLTLHLIIGALVCLICLRLGRPSVGNLYIYVLVTALVMGTVPKLSLLATGLLDRTKMARDNPELLFITGPDLTSALGIVTAALGLIAVALYALPPSHTVVTRDPVRELPSTRRLKWLLLAIAILSAVTVALTIILQLSSLGQQVRQLPLGFDSIINRTRSNVAPALATLALFYATRLRTYEKQAILLIVAQAVLNSYTTTSRGNLFSAAITVLIVSYLASDQKLSRKIVAAIVLISAIGIATFPLISDIRTERLTGVSTSNSQQTSSSLDSVERVVTRVQGADGILQLQRGQAFLSDVSIAQKFSGAELSLSPYYTSTIVGVTQANDFRSPGLVGAALIIGGERWFSAVFLVIFVGYWIFGRIMSGIGTRTVSSALMAAFALEFNEGLLSLYPTLFFTLLILGVAVVDRILRRTIE